MRIDVGFALLLAFAVGCAETGTSPNAGALRDISGGTVGLLENGESAPEGVPAEYQLPTMLYSVEPDAGFTDAYAYAQSVIRYFGTNALTRATVITQSASTTSESQTYDLIPASRSHITSVNHFLGTCVGQIQGIAYGKVWNEFPIARSFLNWGAKSDTEQATKQCPSVPPSSGSGGGGGGGGASGGGGGDDACYTLWLDHYVYYPDTGDVEYLYSDYHTWCEGSLI